MWSLVAGIAAVAMLLGWIGRKSDSRVLRAADNEAEGGVFALSTLLEERGPLPIHRVLASDQKVTLDLGEVSLGLLCYWPPRMVPRNVIGLSWNDNVGWLVDVDSNGKTFRVYASRVEVHDTTTL